MNGIGWVRLVIVLGAAGLVAVGILAGHSPGLLIARVDDGLQTVRNLGDAGRALFAAVQLIVAVSGILPASMLGVAAGVLYGLPTGFALSSVSTLAGAVLAFALSRSMLRPVVSRFLARRSRLRELDGMIARDGWRIACLLRVSPIMPFAATSYALGLSSIGLRDYVIGTLAAMPALFGYVLLGTLAESGMAVWSSSNPLGGWMLALGACATLALTLRVGQLVARVVRPAPASLGEDLAS
jgi:uncharacterized membrane protein YdjX (TVP38/TMEM64 family)